MRSFTLAAFADEADTSLAGQIRALTDNGITRLEIRGVDGENISRISKERAKEISSSLKSEGISVWSVGSPYGKIRITDDFDPHFESFRHGLELAHILGAKNMRIFSFYVSEGERSDFRERVLSRIDSFVREAEGSGVTLCHENEKGIYGYDAEGCVEIHRTFPTVKAVFDPANFVQCGCDVRAAWETLCPYVAYMHVKDALSDGSIVPAGMGEGEIPYLLQRYGGEVLTLEPHLWDFVGLSELEEEKEGKIRSPRYRSSRNAFDSAVYELKKIINAL